MEPLQRREVQDLASEASSSRRRQNRSRAVLNESGQVNLRKRSLFPRASVRGHRRAIRGLRSVESRILRPDRRQRLVSANATLRRSQSPVADMALGAF